MEDYYARMMLCMEKMKLVCENLPRENARIRDLAFAKTPVLSRKISLLEEELSLLRSQKLDGLATITILEEQLKKKDAELDAVKSKLTQITTLEAKLKNKEDSLRDKDVVLDAFKSKLSQRNQGKDMVMMIMFVMMMKYFDDVAIVTTLKAELKNKKDSLREKDVELGAVKSKLTQITTLEAKLKNKEDSLREKDVQLGAVKSKLSQREGEIFEAKLRLAKRFPFTINGGQDDPRRIISSLNLGKFKKACRLNRPDPETENKTNERALELGEMWITLLDRYAKCLRLPVKQLNDLKVTYGEEIHEYLLKKMQEIKLSVELDVSKQPWNEEEDRPKTLCEMVAEIPRRLLPRAE